MLQLAKIAEIRTGFTFRTKLKEVAEGNVHVLQVKDLRTYHEQTDSDLLDCSHLPQTQWEGKESAHIAPNTVILPAKGNYFRAACLTNQASQKPLIASSQFMLITLTNDQVLPEFLCWTLNRPRMQRYLLEIASHGTSISMLNMQSTKELKLNIPTLATQEKILHLNRLWAKTKQLNHRLMNNQNTMLQGVFQQLLTENR